MTRPPKPPPPRELVLSLSELRYEQGKSRAAAEALEAVLDLALRIVRRKP